jgi:enterochelin esterase-like enzyme
VKLDAAAPVLLGLAAVVLTAVLLAVTWDRGNAYARAALIAVSVVALLMTSVLELNRQTETYPTWSALSGSAAPAFRHRGPVGRPPSGGGAGGRIVELTIPGRVSGMTMPAYVYLPAGYGSTHLRYPVLEATHGFPGSPRAWLRRMDVARHLDQEIAAGRMAPTVVVFPYQTPSSLVDTECTNLVGGPQAETYLTRDVPAAVDAHLRVRRDRAGWGLIGYSAGGFCSTDLILRHPGQYAAAASLSGYAAPGITIGDGSERTGNNPAWRLRHLPQPAVALYLAYAADDRHSRTDNLLLARLAHAPLTTTTAVVTYGGHSDAVWQAMEGPAFDWLSARLARPVVP